MSLKANKATVSTALHTKANKTDVDAKFASVDAQLRLLSQQMQEQVSVTPPMPPPPTIVPESKAIEPPQPHVHSLITTVSSTLDVLRSDLRGKPFLFLYDYTHRITCFTLQTHKHSYNGWTSLFEAWNYQRYRGMIYPRLSVVTLPKVKLKRWFHHDFNIQCRCCNHHRHHNQ